MTLLRLFTVATSAERRRKSLRAVIEDDLDFRAELRRVLRTIEPE
jgi:hypothetical protein